MRLNRSKNAVRNVGMGFLYKFVTLFYPYALRAVFIRTLGSEFLGMSSLFSSILTVLNLTELGFSSAIVFSMYKPVAEDDMPSVNALLYFYKTVYRCVGLIILVLGLAAVPFLPKLIKGSYPETVQLTTVYLVFLGNTVLSYFMFAYLRSLITVHQRQDVLSRINIFIETARFLLQIAVLQLVRNYYAYILIMPLFTVINNIRTAIVAKRMFPQYHAEGKLDPKVKADIWEKVKGLLVSRICNVTRNSFDSIFMSAYLGLTQTAMYNNYYHVLSSVTGFMSIFITAVNAGAGNSVAMESTEKNYRDMNRMNFAYMWLGGWCAVCMLCLYQPFMKIWMGDNMLFPFPVVFLFCLYFYVLKMGDIRYVYVSASGIWWQLRYRAIAEAVANISLNWLLGKYFGAAGIVSATLISLFFINFCWGSQLVFKHYFVGISPKDYYLYHAFYFGVTCVVAAVSWLGCSFIRIDGIPGLLVKMVFCAVVPNVLFYLFYFKTPYFKESVPWLMKRVRKALRHG